MTFRGKRKHHTWDVARRVLECGVYDDDVARVLSEYVLTQAQLEEIASQLDSEPGCSAERVRFWARHHGPKET